MVADSEIRENTQRLLKELPAHVSLVCAAKSRSLNEIQAAISAGIKIVGENYVQEAEAAFRALGNQVKWHMIGHLQINKVKKAVKIFDLIETLDSMELAGEIDQACAKINKQMPALVEVNIANEPHKAGVPADEVEALLRRLSSFSHLRIEGLMAMGPLLKDPQDLRPLFAQAKILFEKIQSLNLANVQMRYLSMGMSDSYRVAIEEGANLVRIGTRIFGERR
jgi:pyridoxal phosphate enzyme (YggS family)